MTERDVERALEDLGRHLRYPETPDLASRVPATVEDVRPLAPAPRARRRRMVLLAAATLLLVLGGLAALVPGVRAAIVRVLTLGAVRIEVGAPPSSPPVGRELELGRPVTFAEAQREVSFRIELPKALGAPDAVYDDPIGDFVWLAYEARPRLPAADETGLGLLISEVRGRPEGEFLLKKVPIEGTEVESVRVGDAPGFWFEGPPHELLFIRNDGTPIFDRTRLAGNTLIWVEGDITYRLESALDREEAIALAETFV